MKKLLGLLLACLVSFSAAAQTEPLQRDQATKDLEYGVIAMDVNLVQSSLNRGANPRAVGVYGDGCHDILASAANHAAWNLYKYKDQAMQIIRLLVEHGADMTAHACRESALEEALHNVARFAGNRDTYKSSFDILDLMLSLTDSSKALSTVNPVVIEILIDEAGFNHPELFRYLIDKGLKVQRRYIQEARQYVEDQPEVGAYKEVAGLLQQAYEEQSPEFIKAVVKRNLEISAHCPALKKQF